jgi:hypothetical protein
MECLLIKVKIQFTIVLLLCEQKCCFGVKNFIAKLERLV